MMKLYSVHLKDLFGDPIDEARINALKLKLARPELAGEIARANEKSNMEKRAETLAWLYLLANSGAQISEIKRDENGKPFCDAVQFNASHSDGLCVLAVGDRPIGVDVERVRPFSAREKFAARYFSESERAEIERAADPAEEFFGIWTKKEAYLKMTGEGLRADISALETADIAAETRALTVRGEKYIISICEQDKMG